MLMTSLHLLVSFLDIRHQAAGENHDENLEKKNCNGYPSGCVEVGTGNHDAPFSILGCGI